METGTQAHHLRQYSLEFCLITMIIIHDSKHRRRL